jgi:hypothetical protein
MYGASGRLSVGQIEPDLLAEPVAQGKADPVQRPQCTICPVGATADEPEFNPAGTGRDSEIFRPPALEVAGHLAEEVASAGARKRSA